MARKLIGMYFAVIEKVFLPGDPLSISKYQYEYQLLVTVDLYAQMPCRAIRMDPFGSLTDYEDSPLAQGSRVYVEFPRGDTELGVILGGARQFTLPSDGTLDHYWRRRFNEIVETVYKDGSWEVASLNGPFVKLTKTSVSIDNAAGDSVIFDATNKNITIQSNAMKVNVVGNVDINVQGDTNLTGQGNVNVEGKQINLGKDASQAVLKGNDVLSWINGHLHPTSMGISGSPVTPMPDSTLSKKVRTE